ncbi:aspartyl protease family protein [Sphingomonas sp. QA11]|uniref:aspartyl protease family protein n=1 Tax=Sphingomonas sp. QA11 TaxID=2950605 RepID=UPI00234BC3B8|nr:aspartyl protease family protein [Sphingomonas sp. QA11]WCM26387.1 aspartyl protease family protein [Sphingomonas sp. QA11]
MPSDAPAMRRLILVSLAMAAVAPGASVAQDPTPPPTPTVLDIGSADDRMTVPVSIGNSGPFHFIVDTGAQRTVISRELAGKLGLPSGRDVRLTAMTGTSNVATVMIPKISVSTMGGTSIEAPSLESRNLGALGMLGLDTLQGHALTIDFAKDTMTLTPSAKRRRSISAMPGEIVVHGQNLYGQLIVSDASYRGQKIRVILDTGSGITMGNMALKRSVAHGAKAVRPVALWGVTGESMEVGYTQIDKVDFAGITFSHLPVAFSDAEPFRHFGLTEKPALLLGMDALRLFRRVKIDFPNREVRIMVMDG